MARAVEGSVFSPESCREAELLKTYCEARFSVGESTVGPKSITGQPYSQFCLGGYPTAEAARLGAQACFDEYANGKVGTLYWRVPPEIAYWPRQKVYAFYMRLLISNKPRLS